MSDIDQVACDSAREIMELVSGKMPVGGLPQLQAMVQNIVAEAMRVGVVELPSRRNVEWYADEKYTREDLSAIFNACLSMCRNAIHLAGHTTK